MRQVQGHHIQASGVRKGFLGKVASKRLSENEEGLSIQKEESISGRGNSICKDLKERE